MEDSQYQPLNFSDVLYLATRGGARLLDREHELGALEVGQLFDSLLIDMEGDEFILLPSLTLEVFKTCFSFQQTPRLVLLAVRQRKSWCRSLYFLGMTQTFKLCS